MTANNFSNILVINASAGSGKTYQLTLRYLSLLFLGAHPSKILAVTFTKKAAKEMRERIAHTLMKLANGEISAQEHLYKEIQSVYNGDIKKRSEILLAQFLSSNNKISTIDSFVHQILRKFCFYAGVRHDFELYSVDKAELKKKFLDVLGDESERFAHYLIGKNETIDKIIGLFASLYEEESDLKKIKKEFEGFDRAEFFAASKRFLTSANLFYEFLSSAKPQKFPPRFFASVSEFLKTSSFEKLITERESLSAHRDYKALSNEQSEALFASLKRCFAEYLELSAKDTIAFLLHGFDKYKKAKEGLNREKNALGFDDIAKIVKELLEEEKVDSDFLYFRLDGEIDHILIDEFQDTSILQFRIIRPLLDEILSGIGAREFKSFFLVGDPKQSIYRFRGAAAGMFENATRYIKAKAEDRYNEMFLDTNYRSAKIPVAFVNDTFKPLYGDIFKTQNSASDKNGFVDVLSVDADALLRAVAEKIREFLDGGARESDITILGYTNDDIEEIASFLENVGIKTQKESSKTLAADEGVAAVMAFLEFLALRRLGKDARLAELNFLALTKSTKEDFELLTSKLLHISSPSKIVFETIDFFALSSPNTVKLIEIAALYDDLYLFLSSKAVENQQKISIRSGGVNLMTVHKSKGLEFEYCIVCDTLKKRDNSKMLPILTTHKNFALSKLIVTSKSAKLMLPDVKAAMEEEEAMSRTDLQNANYVAMTRAKNGMCIIKKNNGFSKLEALGISNMSTGKKEFIASKEVQKEPEKYGGMLLDVKLGAQKDFLQEEVYLPNDYAAINFGVAMHAYFESLSGLKNSDIAKTYIQNKYGLKLGSSFESVLSLAKSFDVNKLVAKAQIYKEISVCEEVENKTIKLYRIDLLLISDNKAIVIDFKSSYAAKEGYKKQIGAYGRIVSSILNLPVETYLALNRGGRLEAVLVK